MFGCIEAGGTKFVCALCNETGEILERIQIPTTLPSKTLEQVFDFFGKHEIKGLGVGSFGPIDVNQNSATYGMITSTPKAGWTNFPFLQTLKKKFQVPIGFHTDVNAAALGELTYGAAKGFDGCLYLTVGTGIGGGAITHDTFLEGISHPEMGHIPIRRHPKDSYEGNCVFHGDCLEGLAAGPAIEKRWGMKGDQLKDRKEVWEMEAFYLAQAVTQYILTLSPKKIILGGGVMKQAQLFPLIRTNVKTNLNGYLAYEEITNQIDQYIVPPMLGDDAGIRGAYVLAKRACL
ncbi:ROK family protein [Virgibacillus halodenitrificans]|uniref:ROK family protein n=1 Tax=Virgibacillus halodenitrificans TaxID=1482 RepID=UPI001F1DB8F6|nr:ROK family protein [Virgibacillus halodenitrificans]MCG1027109.1 ROK family protein [Virgibacillus halodenitrificans]